MFVVTPLERAWHFRELIRAVVRRELTVRFRGSMLGWLWAIFGPLVMLTFYTIIFSKAVGVPASARAHGVFSYAISIFSGLIFFNLFSELAYRAPMLLHEHTTLHQKVDLSERNAGLDGDYSGHCLCGNQFRRLLIFQLALSHWIPLTFFLLPFIFIPFFMFLLGATWFLMALGSFTRDVTHLMASIIPVFMFATPIFYSMSDVPKNLQPLFKLNIVGDYIDMMRDLLLFGRLPDPFLYVGTVLASLFVFAYSYRFFMRYKAVFVDVI